MKSSISLIRRKQAASCRIVGLVLAVALLVLCPIAAPAQGTPPTWVQAYGPSWSGSNLANAIKVGPDQNLYVAGQVNSANFGNTDSGPFDLFLAKYSPSGSLLWIAPTVQDGGDSFNAGNGVDMDDNGNVYMTGSVGDYATFYSATPAGTKITVSSVQNEIFLAKYTSSGTLLWVQTGMSDCPFYLDCPIIGYGVAVNSAAGSVYIAGVTQDNTTFSSADGTSHVIPGSGAWHMALAKYDTGGNFQWAELDSAEPNSVGVAVAVDAADNAYTVGWLENTTTFTGANGQDITIAGFSPGQSDSNYPDDIYLAKYDKNGNAKWVNHIGGYKAIPEAVTIGPSGEITLVGFIGNINYGSPGEANTIVTSQPPGANINLGGGIFTNPFNMDEVIATYDPNGVVIRAKRHGGAGNESATGVAYDSRDNLYVTGLVEENPQRQLFVDEYSGNSLLWEATADAGIWPGGITPAVAVDAAGSVFVAGGYQGTASFGNIKLSGTGDSEVFVAELNTAFANQSADLLLRPYVSPTTVEQGDLLTFTFPVWNRGPNVAYLEALNMQVPEGTTFDYIRVSGTPGLGTCTHPPYQGTGAIVCHENSSMAPNTTWTVRLTVRVTAPSGTVITENAASLADTPDPHQVNNTATVSIKVQ